MFKSPSGRPARNYFLSFPAPTKGLDASAPPFSQSERAAKELYNFIVTTEGLQTRPGCSNHVGPFLQTVDSLHLYAGVTGAESLWAACNNGLFNATTSGAAVFATALTKGDCSSVQIGTGAGNYLFLVNGVDTCKRYNGTSWTSIPTFGTEDPVATQDFVYVALYRQRLFFAVKDSLTLKYLPPNAIEGEMIEYSLAATFSQGGRIVAMIPWTIDAGTGPEDNMVIISSQGQVAVFNGNDPAIWALRGVYEVGVPLGSRPLCAYGGDVILITQTGISTLSSFVQSTSIDRVQTLTQNVRSIFNGYAKEHTTDYGWQIIIDDLAPFVLVNAPEFSGRSYQGVMHSQTLAWSVWENLNARAWGRLGQYLYFSTGVSPFYIRKLDPDLAADAGTQITCRFVQAFSRWGYAGNKMCTALKPYFVASQNFAYDFGVSYDLWAPLEQSTVSQTVESPGDENVINDWRTCPDIYSPWKSVTFTIRTSLGRVLYAGSDVTYLRGGHF